MKRFFFQSSSPAHTRDLGMSLAKALQPGDVLALRGEMGSGKTTFVKAVAEGLGIDATQVSSPTFVICQEYGTAAGMGEVAGVGGVEGGRLVHIDAYRIQGVEDLQSIGFDELLEARDSVLAIEWAERVEDALPSGVIDIAFAHVGDHARLITIEIDDTDGSRVAAIESLQGSAQCKVNATCRRCGRELPGGEESQHFPFCSSRCRLSDLGQWFSERYRTSRAVQAQDEELDA